MCGIMTAFNLDGIEHIDQAMLMQSIESVEHRGPDNLGHFRDKNCFLGHARLSIVGIEESANQPFLYEDLILTYNGEIFNYVELRDELTALGYKFTTASDTEVVIKSFHHWGVECFKKFNGMWALVIYDAKNRSIIVSRDRFGQKPLFVSLINGTYYFSSEAHQLFEHTSKRPNYSLMQKFLKEGGFKSEGQTFFLDIEEFPKAHYFVISKKEIRSYRYWDYPMGKVSKTTEQSFKEFESLLEDSVRIRLRSDVPLGLMLSGGVDSTIIGSIIRGLLVKNQKLQAFTYASEDEDDESKYAKIVADRLNFDITISSQDADSGKYIDRLTNLVKKMGRGHSSSAIVSIDYLYESAKNNNIKVILDGQGADELLAGYKVYFFEIIATQLFQRKFEQALINIKNLFSPGGQLKNGFKEAVVLFLRNTLPPGVKSIMRRIYGYEKLFCRIGMISKKRIVSERNINQKNSNALNRLLQRQHSNGLENLLFYGDIVAMNNSVENRSPFMDHRLVEFCFKHDEILKVYDSKEKVALRSTSNYSKFTDVLDRDKIGFSSNIKVETKNKMIDILRESDILNWPIFSKYFSEFIDGNLPLSNKYERILFRIFQVHLWQNNFLKPKGKT